jgi:hypothetical protein
MSMIDALAAPCTGGRLTHSSRTLPSHARRSAAARVCTRTLRRVVLTMVMRAGTPSPRARVWRRVERDPLTGGHRSRVRLRTTLSLPTTHPLTRAASAWVTRSGTPAEIETQPPAVSRTSESTAARPPGGPKVAAEPSGVLHDPLAARRRRASRRGVSAGGRSSPRRPIVHDRAGVQPGGCQHAIRPPHAARVDRCETPPPSIAAPGSPPRVVQPRAPTRRALRVSLQQSVRVSRRTESAASPSHRRQGRAPRPVVARFCLLSWQASLLRRRRTAGCPVHRSRQLTGADPRSLELEQRFVNGGCPHGPSSSGDAPDRASPSSNLAIAVRCEQGHRSRRPRSKWLCERGEDLRTWHTW